MQANKKYVYQKRLLFERQTRRPMQISCTLKPNKSEILPIYSKPWVRQNFKQWHGHTYLSN